MNKFLASHAGFQHVERYLLRKWTDADLQRERMRWEEHLQSEQNTAAKVQCRGCQQFAADNFVSNAGVCIYCDNAYNLAHPCNEALLRTQLSSARCNILFGQLTLSQRLHLLRV